jgi:hypothetical protein
MTEPLKLTVINKPQTSFRTIVCVCLLAFSFIDSLESHAQCKLDRSNYQIVFQEEFNVESIQQIDTNIWRLDSETPGHGFGDNQAADGTWNYGEYYDKSQVSIDSGKLKLTLKKLRLPVKIPYQGYSKDPDGFRYPKFKSGMIQLRRNLCTRPFEGTPGWGGFKYALIEARIKIPPGPTFPAFWTDGMVNAQVLEGKESPKEFLSEAGYGWPHCTQLSAHMGNWKIGPDLSEDFHIYSVVWTPSVITFFLDDREIGTLRGPEVENAISCNAGANTIVVDLAMHGYRWSPELESEFNMYVDWIRVYKPVDNDWSLPYKTSIEFVNHNTFDNVDNPPLSSSEPNSIALIPADENHFFYRGRDDNPYEGFLLKSGLWQIQPIMKFSDNNHKIAGDLFYDQYSGKILYRGKDAKIQYVVWNKDKGWYHGYLGNGLLTYDVLNAAGSMALTGDGCLFFVSPHHNICKWRYIDGADSVETLFDAFSEKCSGDLVVIDSTKLCYRGYSDGIIHFIYDSAAAWHHTIISTSSIAGISGQPGSFCKGRNGVNEIFYVDGGNKIRRLYSWGSNVEWLYDTIAYDYGRLGSSTADLARGNLVYDQRAYKICYFGQDGRLQYFQFNNATSQWMHDYIDSYWNTYAFESYSGSQDPHACPSLVCHPQGSRLFYVGDCEFTDHEGFHEQHHNVRYFDYESCEVDGWKKNQVYGNLRRETLNANVPVNAAARDLNVQVLPNISSSTFSIYCYPEIDFLDKVELLDISGRMIESRTHFQTNQKWDVSELVTGNYFVRVVSAGNVWTRRFTKL